MNSISIGGKWDFRQRKLYKSIEAKRTMQLCSWNVIQIEMRVFHFEPTAGTMLQTDLNATKGQPSALGRLTQKDFMG